MYKIPSTASRMSRKEGQDEPTIGSTAKNGELAKEFDEFLQQLANLEVISVVFR